MPPITPEVLELPRDLQPSAGAPATRRAALITGATGFLGLSLTSELLRAGWQVEALVRERDGRHARRRLIESLRRWELWSEGLGERLRVHAGDVTHARLGLDARTSHALAGRLTDIFHCAAQTNGILPRSVLQATNIEGLVAVLRLCSTGAAKRLHQMSSIAAAGAPARPLSERNRLEYPSVFKNGYAETKWVAEQLAERAAERGFAVTIVRLGALGGHAVSGRSNPFDYRWMLLRAALALEVAPLIDGEFGWLPVDDACRAIAALATEAQSGLSRYHLVSPDRVPWLLAFSWARLAGYRLRVSDLEHWRAELEARGPAELIGLATSVSAGGPSTPAFDADWTFARLAALGIHLRALDPSLFTYYLRRASERGELPAPRAA